MKFIIWNEIHNMEMKFIIWSIMQLQVQIFINVVIFYLPLKYWNILWKIPNQITLLKMVLLKKEVG